jgi:hypothetical protein
MSLSSILFNIKAFNIISGNCCVGMFVYILEISNYAKHKSFSKGICLIAFIRSVEFLSLNAKGRGVYLCR